MKPQTLEEILYAPKKGEGKDEHAKRCAEQDEIFKAALETGPGHRLIQLLYSARNPLHSRFGQSEDATGAAFIDGQCDAISLMLRRGTNLLISRPKA